MPASKRLDEVVIDSRGYAYCGDCADARDAPPAGVNSSADALWCKRATTQCRGVVGQACDGCAGKFVEASRDRANYLDYDVRR